MLKLLNTLTGKLEGFNPIDGKRVNFFVCGPTVYDYSHIGHARTYIVFDIIVRYLKYRGFKVFYLQNITDIDDKIIERAKEENKKPKDIADFFEKEYYKDMKALGIKTVNQYARATDFIGEIINQIERLIEKNFAYVSHGDVYFDISRFTEYGKLSRQKLSELQAGARVEPSQYKKNPLDFTLWKNSKPGEPSWPSPWGIGRPGWHIEDTAISEKFFGPQYDIHCGGRDLIFPHHESEIAQMEAVSGKKPFVKYWLHSGFLTVGGEKMSKSLKNYITIKDLLNRYPAEAFRLFVLQTHYRSPLDFKEINLQKTVAAIEKIKEFLRKLNFAAAKQNVKSIKGLLNTTISKFEEFMDNDFNTPKALSAVFDLIKKVNPLLDKGKLSKKDSQSIIKTLKIIDKVLGILPFGEIEEKIPAKIKQLLKQRENLRKQRKWSEADQIREEIKKLGWAIEDISRGSILKKIHD